jgi:hypothetical protein
MYVSQNGKIIADGIGRMDCSTPRPSTNMSGGRAHSPVRACRPPMILKGWKNPPRVPPQRPCLFVKRGRVEL